MRAAGRRDYCRRSAKLDVLYLTVFSSVEFENTGRYDPGRLLLVSS